MAKALRTRYPGNPIREEGRSSHQGTHPVNKGRKDSKKG